MEAALRQRSSIRAYLPDAIELELVKDILSLARMAPSGANLQPGKFHVLTGQALAELKNSLAEAVETDRPVVTEYSYFPKPLSAELKARQIAAGFALYSALGITRRDVAARREQFKRNYQFFDAPVGIVVTLQKNMGKGCFMDLGMTLMALFMAVESKGLGATGIGALANHGDVVHEALGIEQSEMVVCGVALGMPDREHPVNATRTEREPLESFARFRGFNP